MLDAGEQRGLLPGTRSSKGLCGPQSLVVVVKDASYYTHHLA